MDESPPDTVQVYDTWIQTKTGFLHFDVMATDDTTALTLAKQYLAGVGEIDASLALKECQFCHSEPLVTFSAEQQQQFREQGGFIVKLST